MSFHQNLQELQILFIPYLLHHQPETTEQDIAQVGGRVIRGRVIIGGIIGGIKRKYGNLKWIRIIK
jgi:hypothetical protein